MAESKRWIPVVEQLVDDRVLLGKTWELEPQDVAELCLMLSVTQLPSEQAPLVMLEVFKRLDASSLTSAEQITLHRACALLEKLKG